MKTGYYRGMMFNVEDEIRKLPDSPGVYIMKDGARGYFVYWEGCFAEE